MTSFLFEEGFETIESFVPELLVPRGPFGDRAQRPCVEPEHVLAAPPLSADQPRPFERLQVLRDRRQ